MEYTTPCTGKFGPAQISTDCRSGTVKGMKKKKTWSFEEIFEKGSQERKEDVEEGKWT